MPRMPDNERFDFWAEYMWLISERRQEILVTKHDLRAAINALDDYVEASWLLIEAAHLAGTLDVWVQNNRQEINQAIPLPARTLLTNAQKEWLFKAVVRREARSGD